jgi:hypothetical protein
LRQQNIEVAGACVDAAVNERLLQRSQRDRGPQHGHERCRAKQNIHLHHAGSSASRRISFRQKLALLADFKLAQLTMPARDSGFVRPKIGRVVLLQLEQRFQQHQLSLQHGGAFLQYLIQLVVERRSFK